ncbi:SseB family protein [Aestuariimicrobium ganziense]|uniref:SseB family protein n=1 Tax=Aestuariimicrobium ganziense TaxID=2773677 RepID=UPI001940DBC5|nr:SseB family protein [Aestuariimicrobium ganziense]
MSRLHQPDQRWADDHGEADPQVRAALAAQAAPLGYLRAIVALGGARLLMPIVATGDDHADGPDPDRQAEMAAVTMTNAAGQSALLAFTGLDALQAWDRSARPVPCTLDELAATVGEAGATVLLVDVAGPQACVVGADVVEQLAQGRRLVELEPEADGAPQFGWMQQRPG